MKEMDIKAKPKWYFQRSSIIIGFLILGPFVLPLIWYNPSFSMSKKIIYTVIIFALSLVILKWFLILVSSTHDLYESINS